MSILSEVGKHAMCTHHVLARNEKIVASTYLTSESVLRRAGNKALSTYLKVAFNFHEPFPTTIITTSSMKHLGDRSLGHFTAFPVVNFSFPTNEMFILNPLTGIGALKRPTGSDLLISITLF